MVNDLPLGRNVDEMLRMIDALQFTEKYGEVCPAGWNKGDEGMKPDTDGVASYLKDTLISAFGLPSAVYPRLRPNHGCWSAGTMRPLAPASACRTVRETQGCGMQ